MAQFNLGIMYAKGQGVPEDPVRAYRWLNLAAAGGFEPARKIRDLVKKLMTPQQIAEAQRMAREWYQKRKGK